MHRLLSGILIPIILALVSVSCKTGRTNRLETGAALVYTLPSAGEGTAKVEKWTEVPQIDGKRWAQAKYQMDDLVQLFGFESPCDPAVKSLADLDSVLRTNRNIRFEKLKMDTVLGVPVLRYETLETDKSRHEDIRRLLDASPRAQMEDYQIRSVGAFFYRPSNPPKFVSVGGSRSTTHGALGTYYEKVIEDFISGFAAENAMGWDVEQIQ